MRSAKKSRTQKAKLFRTGGSQAVRLPKDCRFPGTEVLVHREGDRVVLEPLKRRWTVEFLALLEQPPDEEAFPDRTQPTGHDIREDFE